MISITCSLCGKLRSSRMGHQCSNALPTPGSQVESLQRALADLRAQLEACQKEKTAALLSADISEQCARSYDREQPFCEHENRYTFTDDGGKTGHCVMCRNVTLLALLRETTPAITTLSHDLAPDGNGGSYSSEYGKRMTALLIRITAALNAHKEPV